MKDCTFDANSVNCVACGYYDKCQAGEEIVMEEAPVVEISNAPVIVAENPTDVTVVEEPKDLVSVEEMNEANVLGEQIKVFETDFRSAWGTYAVNTAPLLKKVRAIFKGKPGPFNEWCKSKLNYTKATVLLLIQAYDKFNGDHALLMEYGIGKIKAVLALPKPAEFIKENKEVVAASTFKELQKAVAAEKKNLGIEVKEKLAPTPAAKLFRLLRKLNDFMADNDMEIKTIINSEALEVDDNHRTAIKLYVKQITDWQQTLSTFSNMVNA